jgi:hypothetical protein
METSINKGASVCVLYQTRVLTAPSALSYLNVWIANLTFVDMDMSYTRVLHIKVAYRVPHK